MRGNSIDYIDMEIYTRWGENIFTLSGKDIGWDGTYKGFPCQPDVYVYNIIIRGIQSGRPVTQKVSGNITLLR